jgi:DNA-binding FadR family transcriptional regulator
MNQKPRIRISRPSQIVASELRTMILRGELDTDGRLPPEAEFAEQLGVSRHHLREALRMLEQDGLVRIRPGHAGGIFMAVPEADALARTFEGALARKGVVLADLEVATRTLDSAVAELAARNATDEDCARLDAMVEWQHSNGRVDIELSRDFHFAVVDVAHNATLSLLARMTFLVELNSLLGLRGNFDAELSDPAWVEQILRRQRDLVQALRDHDAPRAAEIMRLRHTAWDELLQRNGLDPTTATLPDTW